MRSNMHNYLLAILYGAQAGDRRHDDGAVVAAGDEAEASLAGDIDRAVAATRDVQHVNVAVCRPLEPRRLAHARNVDGLRNPGLDSRLHSQRVLHRCVHVVVPHEQLVDHALQVFEGHRRPARKVRHRLGEPGQHLAEGSPRTQDEAQHVELLGADAGGLGGRGRAGHLQEEAEVLPHKRQHRRRGVPPALDGALRRDPHPRRGAPRRGTSGRGSRRRDRRCTLQTWPHLPGHGVLVCADAVRAEDLAHHEQADDSNVQPVSTALLAGSCILQHDKDLPVGHRLDLSQRGLATLRGDLHPSLSRDEGRGQGRLKRLQELLDLRDRPPHAGVEHAMVEGLASYP
mmetsp:Transcript_6482/g.16056  ORF Transcript_6482/g.16056 Transcript_6482/m.16056 type:complete len:343 (+) Transcript_6482:686-1714(+)